MIRLTIDPSPTPSPRRGYRRLEWIETAIGPLEPVLASANYKRLRDALAVCLGTEAYIVLRDVCGASSRQAERTTVWTARTLVHSAMASTGRADFGLPD